jgi:hypothetical protein
VRSKSDFWLTLHKLAHDLDQEGDAPHEQAESVCEVFSAMSPAARAVYLSDVEKVLAAISEVAVSCKHSG